MAGELAGTIAGLERLQNSLRNQPPADPSNPRDYGSVVNAP
jgi:hypothetical protein